ncbi:MAG: dipeptidase PepE [Salibacteraceae bacterium]|nr:dipeptidase PepE [Salibacteraceae bacterium]|tara:strand:- start:11603 stop:12316 length:714 start_codon:yes stop_codon:yes gene_type:complete
MKRLLLLSNSSIPSEPYFNWGKPFVKSFLGSGKIKVLFIPYAGVTMSYDEYTKTVSDVFSSIGHEIVGIHEYADPKKAIEECEALAVGGGNTFRLFQQLQELDLMDTMNNRINAGTPYMGWSAGSNTTCPNLFTTNDMPIVQPQSFDGLGQIPFQLNVHYSNASISGHGGETRDTRLKEFKVLHPDTNLIGLRECSLIEIKGDRYFLKGRGNTMKLFRNDGNHEEIGEGEFNPNAWV